MGWIVRNGICYKKSDGTTKGDNAASSCEAENAYLAEIPNIYVDNIITEIIGGVGGDDYWTGLRTSSTHYYWRIGDFPLGDDTPPRIDRCGTVEGNNGSRWNIRGRGAYRGTICMIGKQLFGYKYIRLSVIIRTKLCK